MPARGSPLPNLASAPEQMVLCGCCLIKGDFRFISSSESPGPGTFTGPDCPELLCPSLVSGIINFCANNYLGLSSHPEVIQAGLQTLKEFGAGLSSVRFICGTQVH